MADTIDDQIETFTDAMWKHRQRINQWSEQELQYEKLISLLKQRPVTGSKMLDVIRELQEKNNGSKK